MLLEVGNNSAANIRFYQPTTQIFVSKGFSFVSSKEICGIAERNRLLGIKNIRRKEVIGEWNE